MRKLSSKEIAQVLAAVPTTLRKLAQERDDALAKLAQMERRGKVEKLAAEMQRKGLETDISSDALADKLEKAADTRLDTIKQAVDLVGPDMGSRLASLTHDETRATPGTSKFERYIYGDVG